MIVFGMKTVPLLCYSTQYKISANAYILPWYLLDKEKMRRNTPEGDRGRARGIESERERKRKTNGTTQTTTNATILPAGMKQGRDRQEQSGREKARQKKRTCVANKDNFGDDSRGTALFLLLIMVVMMGSKQPVARF